MWHEKSAWSEQPSLDGYRKALGLCSSEFLSSDVTGLVSQAPVAYDFIFLFVMSIIMLGLGLYYVRKEKWADIDKEWDDIVIE